MWMTRTVSPLERGQKVHSIMKVTTFQGVVENGQIRLPVDAILPENATVYVVIPDPGQPGIPRVVSPRLAHPEQASDFQMELIEGTSNAGS
jgi:hypothetical protein